MIAPLTVKEAREAYEKVRMRYIAADEPGTFGALSVEMHVALDAYEGAVRAEEQAQRAALVTALKRLRDFNGGIGTLTLMCAPGESDRDCLNRCRREIDDQVRAALAGEK